MAQARDSKSAHVLLKTKLSLFLGQLFLFLLTTSSKRSTIRLKEHFNKGVLPMAEPELHGLVNGHIVGRVLKEAVRRAVSVIFNERMTFEATTKESYGGTMDDVFTSADTKAQEVYLRTFKECFPDYGVIAEEDELTIAPKNGCPAYFTVDPLDGTKAYVRRQSHGVSTMVALVSYGEIISAYVGDVNTQEVYYYRPVSDKVHRITRLDASERLERSTATEPGEFFAMLRDPLEKYGESSQQLIASGLFKNYEVIGSSIGTWMARLWKNEVSALLIPPGFETPWDSTPVQGITQKLGYVYLRPTDDPFVWQAYDPPVLTEKEHRDHDVLIVHELDKHHFM